ncbi:MAG: TonB-dependent receptor [Lacunisphaera sp.]
MKPRLASAVGAILALLAFSRSPLQAQTNDGSDFSDLSLEELVQVEVSSLGRKTSTVFDTPAPAYIVTNDEIHRSGALDLPDVLRLVPGVQVSRSSSSGYAITIRGFNDLTSNKLLVLMDGRSLYNQLFSGANWTFQDLMLSDVSRVEVQRGPAGTLWGANAVNGVINIVTKNAHSTVGSLVSVAYGDHLNVATEIRQGWNFTPSTAARVYAKYQDQDSDGTTSGTGSKGWNSLLAGARMDWDRPGGGGLTLILEHRELRVKGDISEPTILPPYSEVFNDPQLTRGTDLSMKWTQPVFTDATLSAQASVEHGDTDQFAAGERHLTADIDTQLTLHPLPRNEVITGITYRSTSDHLRSSPWYQYGNDQATTTFIGAFVQDEITLQPQRVSLTIGTKIERNSYSGWETQPSIRLLWHPTKQQTLWASVSHAARTPSRSERDVTLYAETFPPTPDLPIPGKLIAHGASDFSSEHVTAFELGHRFQAGRQFSVDTSLYYSEYSDLRGLLPGYIPPNYNALPVYYTYLYAATNDLQGHTFGGELAFRWQATNHLKFDASVASVRTALEQSSPSAAPDASIAGLIGNTPHEEYKLHAAWDISTQWSLDIFGRHTGRLAESGVAAYTGLDLRLSWRPRPDWEIELVGHDLLDPYHPEISGFFVGSDVQQIARSYFIRVTYKH